MKKKIFFIENQIIAVETTGKQNNKQTNEQKIVRIE